ncbi:membrane protein [Mycobacterium tuberculosis]|nr:membrane protein [Mycobacterium tuberculosis]
MSDNAIRPRPNPWQYIRYCYGARLPDSMRDWVRNDLAGKGAAIRMMIRVAVPAVLVLAPFWLIPTSLDVHLSMTLPILIPFVYFSHALNKVWRRHMLRVHNLDPELVDEPPANATPTFTGRISNATGHGRTRTTNAGAIRRARQTPAPKRPGDRWRRPTPRGSAVVRAQPHPRRSPRKPIALRR